jgi:hypothetical protein
MLSPLRAVLVACAAASLALASSAMSLRGGSAARGESGDPVVPPVVRPPCLLGDKAVDLLSEDSTLKNWQDAFDVAKAKPDAPCLFFSLDDFKKHLTDSTNDFTVTMDKGEKLLDGHKFDEVPFVAKMAFPEGTKVSLFGDLLGNLDPFLLELKKLHDFRTIDEKFKVMSTASNPSNAIVFLGDYLNVGSYDAELFALVLLLRRRNPESVFVGRGHNEEGTDTFINIYNSWSKGVCKNLFNKYGLPDSECKIILRSACSTLPVAHFFSAYGAATEPERWVLAAHGGFEPSGTVGEFLRAPLNKDNGKRKTVYAAFGAKGGPSYFKRMTWNKQMTMAGGNLESKGDAARQKYTDRSGVYTWAVSTADAKPVAYMAADMDYFNYVDYWEDFFCKVPSKYVNEFLQCVLSKRLVFEWMLENDVITIFRGNLHGNLPGLDSTKRALKLASTCVF